MEVKPFLYKNFKKHSSNILDYHKLVGDKVEKLDDNDDMNSVYSKDNLFKTELCVFGLSATIKTTFFPITLDAQQGLFFESMIFSDIEELNCKYSKKAKSLKDALFDHYELASLAFGYLKGHYHSSNKPNPDERIDIKNEEATSKGSDHIV